MGELMNIKGLSEGNKKTLFKELGNNLRQAWYFDKWYEKLILVGLCVLGLWKIIGFF